jgi:hypothetical protein
MNYLVAISKNGTCLYSLICKDEHSLSPSEDEGYGRVLCTQSSKGFTKMHFHIPVYACTYIGKIERIFMGLLKDPLESGTITFYFVYIYIYIYIYI